MRRTTSNFLRILRTRLGPWLVWLATVSAAAWIFVDIEAGPTIVGFAHGVEYPVGPIRTARVTTVAVEVGQEVKEGQVLVLLDPTEIERDIAVLEAEYGKAQAELLAATEEAMREAAERHLSRENRLALLEQRLMETRGSLMTADAERKAKRIERTRVKKLVDARLAERGRLAELDARIATLDARADAAESSVKVYGQRLKEAKAVVDATIATQLDIITGPQRHDIEVINTQLHALRARRSELVLRAPSSGRVAEVRLHPGSVTGPDEPVVKVIGEPGGRVIACVGESQALDVRVGDPATVWARRAGSEPMGGHVVGLGPLVEKVPSRCRPNMGQQLWGRDVVILLDDVPELLPGQAMDVRLDPAKGQRTGLRAAGPRVAPDAPIAMTVLDALRERTRFEPSGLVWVPRLARYVVVSDDTGHPGDKDRVSWLFTMDAKGRVDPLPMGVIGVDAFNDLEAVAAGSGDSLYALSSQSLSRKKKRPKSREQLMKLIPEGSGFRVDGMVHLASLLEALEPDALNALGITDTKSLDIEGMSSDREGLLLGLKSPLSSDGKAIIWRISDPAELLLSGSLDRAGLHLWGTVELTLGLAGKQQRSGISELLVLPDGTLLLASTVQEEAEAAESMGGLFWANEAAPGQIRAKHLRTFPGLKPEGLSLSPTVGQLTVVFDRGSEVPYWTEIPWPTR